MQSCCTHAAARTRVLRAGHAVCTCARPQVQEDAPRAKVRRTDPALELEALRERVQALQLENVRLQEVAAAAEARAAAAEARAVAAEPQAPRAGGSFEEVSQEDEGAYAAEVSWTPEADGAPLAMAYEVLDVEHLRCRSPTASTASSSQSSDRNALAHAHSLVRQVVHFERTGTEALVDCLLREQRVA